MDIIQQKFIGRVLRDEGKRFVRNQGYAIRKELLFHTGKTMNDRQSTASDTTLSLSMPIHVRFLDIKKNTTSKKKGSGFRSSKKGYRIYNRFKEGHKLSIANRLATEYTAEMIADIRKKLNT